MYGTQAASLSAVAQNISDFEKISNAMNAAESVFARIAELAGDLVGPVPMAASQTKDGSGAIGHLSNRAEQVIEYANQMHGEIDRIRAATRY